MPFKNYLLAYITRSILCLALFSCVVSGVSLAADQMRPAGLDDTERVALRQLFKEAAQNPYKSKKFSVGDLEDFIVKLLQAFDPDRDGVEPQEFEFKKKIIASEVRSEAIAKVLSHDLNDDLKVTGKEISASLAGRFVDLDTRFLKKQHDQILKMDPNQDGLIERNELHKLTLHGREASKLRKREAQIKLLTFLMNLDPNRDSRLTENDALQITSSIFPEWEMPVRKDQTPVSPKSEKMPMSRRAEFQPLELRKQCTAPPALSGSEVILIGTYSGGSYSTTSLSDTHAPTAVSTVVVESGDSPVYLVLVSLSSVVWQFTGATERLQHVLLVRATRSGSKGKQTPGVGYVGLPSAKATIVKFRNCLFPFNAKNSFDAVRNEILTEQLVGRRISETAGFKTLTSVLVPSGKLVGADTTDRILRKADMSYVDAVVRKINARFKDDEQLRVSVGNWRKWLFQRYPEGITEVPSNLLISEQDSEIADPMPPLATYFKYLNDGTWDVAGPDEIIIRKSIRTLRGGGLHKLKLTLAKGVPEPELLPRGVCVFSTDKGEFIAGKDCK